MIHTLLTPFNDLAQLLPESRLRHIGALAVDAFLLARAHESNIVGERQNRLGPGVTKESHDQAMQAAALMEQDIWEAFGAAQIARDNGILHAAVLARVSDDHEIVTRLGHELTDRDRYELTRLRAIPEADLQPAGVSGVSENAHEDTPS